MTNFYGKVFKKSKEVKSLKDFIDLVEEAKIFLKTDEIWYRGQANSQYKLVPNIYRKDSLEYSHDLETNLPTIALVCNEGALAIRFYRKNATSV